MNKHLVSIVSYEKPLESVRNAVELSKGLAHLTSNARVFIKPNIVFWTKAVPFPKWGVITTSRVVEDMIVLLKERGIDDITIGEGTVTMNMILPTVRQMTLFFPRPWPNRELKGYFTTNTICLCVHIVRG